MDGAGASDIDGPQVPQEAVVPPNPPRRHAVDDGVEQREKAISFKVTSASTSSVGHPLLQYPHSPAPLAHYRVAFSDRRSGRFINLRNNFA
jgi:hypothetical protein